jgi:hypothetical protein
MNTSVNLSGQEYREMQKMLADLTPAERASLLDPNFITEDEADVIVCNRRMNEPELPLSEIFAEFGYPRRKHG